VKTSIVGLAAVCASADEADTARVIAVKTKKILKERTIFPSFGQA
jgi:hypothetical protein